MFRRGCAIMLFVSYVLLLCSACETSGKNSVAQDLTKFLAEAEFNYTERMGKTAVLTKETVLLNPYSYIYEDPEDCSTYSWIGLDLEYSFDGGDIVLLLTEVEGLSRVVVPYGDIPWIYGYLPSNFLSTDPLDIKGGNQAIVDKCALYNAVGGTVLETASGRVEIQSSDNEWSGIQKSVGGDDTVYWVQSKELSFEFDTLVLDVL